MVRTILKTLPSCIGQFIRPFPSQGQFHLALSCVSGWHGGVGGGVHAGECLGVSEGSNKGMKRGAGQTQAPQFG